MESWEAAIRVPGGVMSRRDARSGGPVNGSRSVLVRTGEEIIDLLRNGQGVLNIVPLAGVKDEVDNGLLQLRPRPGA